MKKFLIVVNMQKDFVDGALGTNEAQAIVENVARKIEGFDGGIIVTYDTHGEDYMQTAEGRKLPAPHCIKGTPGWQLNARVEAALAGKHCTRIEKPSFGSVELPQVVGRLAGGEDFTAEFVGLCTDICVVSNALLVKASYPEMELYVDASCCAGVTPATHEAALTTMRSCQINVIGE